MRTIAHVDELLVLGDEEFLEQAYTTLLGRHIDPVGQHYYLHRLRTGHGREKAIAQMMESPEGRVRNVELAGLDELLAAHRKSNQWFWRVFSRSVRIERHLQRLENMLCNLAQQRDEVKRLLNPPVREVADQDNAPGQTRQNVIPGSLGAGISPQRSTEISHQKLETIRLTIWAKFPHKSKTSLEDLCHFILTDQRK
jgi:hypothetical protein